MRHLPTAATVLLLPILLLAPAPATAQLVPPNETGVAMGHVHLFVRDVEAMRQFLRLLGGVPTQNGTLQMVRFPGAYVNLGQRDMNTGGSAGSVVNHFGFHVRSVAETVARIAPLGLKVDQNNPQQAFVTAPDDVRVELLQDETLPVPIRMHHIHLALPAPLEAQAWYVKHFGAAPGKRGTFDNATVPGVELSFTRQETAQAPTQGRSLDHIGFEVPDLDAFLKRLRSLGITEIDGPRLGGNKVTKISYIKDPWGTRIEITEGLEPR
jgi:catechol 2,3-dioxygenase-like lactoylglutathione lyase family enzyme